MADVILTTSDNPWNPFTNWNEWYAFDEGKKYCTCGLIARFSDDNYGDSEYEQNEERVQAIARVLELFPFGPIGIENDSQNNPIVYELIEKDGKRINQTDSKACASALNLKTIES